jgi:CRISPR system Cascade subunit CasA
VRDHADPATQLVAVETGHPFLDRGFEGLMRDLLQIALAPKDARAWAARLLSPPSPDELAAAFAPYRPALVIDDDTAPALQVRPARERLGEATKQPRKRQQPAAPRDEEEDETDEGGASLPIGLLLPEQPTDQAMRSGLDFFTHGLTVKAVAPGLALPLLYASMVLFPAAGGGYYGLPHGADSIKYQITGRTLWETLWANVLCTDDPRLGGAPFPPPSDPRLFPWLDPRLPHMSLQRKHLDATLFL